MADPMKNIRWVGSFEEGLALARQLKKPVALKPLGQGMGVCDDW